MSETARYHRASREVVRDSDVLQVQVSRTLSHHARPAVFFAAAILSAAPADALSCILIDENSLGNSS